MQLTSNEYHIISIEYIESLLLLRDYNIDISIIGSSDVIISCNLCNIESVEELITKFLNTFKMSLAI